MTEKDKLELMRRFEPFGREIPKDQVMSVIARVPTTDRPKGESLLGTEMSLSKWVPCSERLPSKKKAVLICDRRGNRFAGELVLTDTGYKWKIPLFTVWMDIEDGDAWMPLPEPYKGGEDE